MDTDCPITTESEPNRIHAASQPHRLRSGSDDNIDGTTSVDTSSAIAMKPFLIALSGPSSSGKTTIARLLKRILPNATILHEDDFYLPDSQIPYRSVPKRDTATGSILRTPTGGVVTVEIQDWDCVEALNIMALRDTLLYIKEHGDLPKVNSIQGQNPVGPGGEIDSAILDQLRTDIIQTSPTIRERIVIIVDGFMLFTRSTEELLPLFDLRLLLHIKFSEAKKRREGRKGYATLESFWEDPPFYVDDVVWPNYVEQHAFLFENGDVDGKLDKAICEELCIHGMPMDCGHDLVKLIQWTVGKLAENLASLRE